VGDAPILITPAGRRKLQAELEHLWKVERPRVTQEVSDAAALGDRSENAEYIYGKKRLREIDRRLQWLAKRLERVTVLDPARTADRTRVGFGAQVTLEDEDGGRVTYQLVGPDEFDVDAGRISIDSPVARGLLGKEVDDEVEIRRPRGPVVFTILAIAWPADAG
jgi:transcription elongation factor GreB